MGQQGVPRTLVRRKHRRGDQIGLGGQPVAKAPGKFRGIEGVDPRQSAQQRHNGHMRIHLLGNGGQAGAQRLAPAEADRHVFLEDIGHVLAEHAADDFR